MTDRTVTPPAAPTANNNGLPKPQGADVPARVVGATGNLANVARPVTLAGVITGLNDDGTAQVSTAQGDVDIILRPQSGLTDGQQVTIDVAAGRPPRQAIIRLDDSPAPANPNEDPTAPSSTPVTTPVNIGGARTNPPANTPTNLPPPTPPGPISRGDLPVAVLTDSATADVTSQLQASPQSPPVQSPLQPGDNVRLLALPPETALALESVEATLELPAATTLTPILPDVAVPSAPTANTALSSALNNNFNAPAPAINSLLTNLEATSAAKIGAPLTPPALSTASAFPATLPTALAAAIVAENIPSGLASNIVKPATPLSLALQTSIPTGAPPPALDIHIVAIAPPGMALQVKATIAGALPLAPKLPIPASSIPTAMSEKTISTPPPTPATLTAQVVGRTENNLPILTATLPGQKFSALFALQFSAANLPVGTTITFTPHADAATENMNALNTDDVTGDIAANPQNLLNGTWPALDATRAALTAANPIAAANFIGILPNTSTPTQIPIAAMLFIAAVRSGDIESWLGDKAIGILRQTGRADLIGKLGRDMEGIGKLDNTPTAPDNWRSIPLPFNHGSELQQMALYYRHDREKSADDQRPEKTSATRFIFDMSLTRLGAVQLDGLHRSQENIGETDGKLDLIVRTKVPLSPDMQQSMRRTYTAALESNRQSGEISFQTRTEQWVKVR